MSNPRVGVIGVGAMGQNHARVVAELPGVELAGVADASAETARSVADRFGVAAYSDYESLLDAGVDAVVIAVPTALHHDTAAAVIDRGVGVLLEKPLAATAAEGEQLLERVQKAGVPFMVGHIERFNPVVNAAKAAMEDGRDIVSVTITRVGPLPPRIKDVGVVTDLGVHDIDLIAHFTGSEFERVECCRSASLGDHEDTAAMAFTMASGCVAQITTNWMTPFKIRRVQIATAVDFIDADLLTFRALRYQSEKRDGRNYSVTELPVALDEPLRKEHEAFLGHLKGETDSPVSAEDGLRALRVVEQCLHDPGAA